MALITDLLQQQVHLYPATFNEEEAEINRGDFDILLAAEIVKQAATPLHRICPTCNGEAVEVHVVSATRAYTLCTIDEEAGRDYFDPTSLKQWVLDTTQLIKLFQNAIGIEHPQVTEIVPGLLWDLGAQSVNGANYHLFFCRNLAAIEPMHLYLITNQLHSAVFYTGQPIPTLDTVLAVPLLDCIAGIDGVHVVVAKKVIEQYFPRGSYAKSVKSQQAKRAKHTVEMTFPEKVRWEKVTIKIRDGMNDAEILYGGRHLATASYAELGFAASAKQQKPDRKWQFLITLSAINFSDPKQATPQNLAVGIAQQSGKPITPENVHTIKKQLSERLMEIFETDEDPFADNKEYYVPQFELLPSPELRNPELRRQGGEYNENVNYDEMGT